MSQPALNPNLGIYKRQAKLLKKQHAAGEPASIARVRQHHPKHQTMSEDEARAADFTLADAQLVVAREYGFPSWRKLKSAVLEASGASDATATDRLLTAIVAGDLESVRAIVRTDPAAANTPDAQGRVALVEACDRGQLEIVSALLDVGADPERGDRYLTPMLAASHPGPHKRVPALDVVQRLVEHGAREDHYSRAALGQSQQLSAMLDGLGDIDARGPTGCTLLYLAVWNGHAQTARLLLEAGADPDVRCVAGRTAFDCALLHAWSPPHRAIGALLLDHGAECTLHDACRVGHLEAVRRVLEAEPELIDQRDPQGLSAVDIAVLGAAREIIELLLQAGAADPHGRARALLSGRRIDSEDLTGATFHRLKLTAATFNDVNLGHATFSNVNLQGALFSNVNLQSARIENAGIQGLTIWGIEVQPLLDAELQRRAPKR